MPRGVSTNLVQRCENVRWSRENEATFIEFMHEQWVQGQLLSTSFSTFTMGQICQKLNLSVRDKTKYTEKKCKTKFQRIKKAWKLLYRLKTDLGSGLEWCYERNTVIGSESVLEPIYDAHSDNRSIIEHGLPHFDMCTDMFHKIVATGEHARSSMQAPEDINDEDDPLDCHGNAGASASPSVPKFAPSSSVRQPGVSSSRSSGKKRSSSGAARDDEQAELVHHLTRYMIHKNRIHGEAAEDEYETCIKMVRDMEGITSDEVVKAASAFEKKAKRKCFLCLNEVERKIWLASLP